MLRVSDVVCCVFCVFSLYLGFLPFFSLIQKYADLLRIQEKKGLKGDSFFAIFCSKLKKHKATHTSNIKKISGQVNQNMDNRHKVMDHDLKLVWTIL